MSEQYDDGFYDGQQDQQVKIDKVLHLIEDFKKNNSDDQRLFLNDLFKQIEGVLKWLNSTWTIMYGLNQQS